MKKIICLILMLLLLPIASVTITGCSGNNYNIKTFYSTYQKIGDNATNLKLVKVEDTYQLNNNALKINIDYSKSTKLSTLVDSTSTPYYQLKHFYQQLLDDSLSPLYFFGEKISSSNKISDKQTEKLFKKLSALKQEYQDIDYNVGILINSINNTTDTTINLSNLRKVFLQYEQAITAANNLSIVVCDVYFNTILSNSNFNYSNKTYEQLTLSDLTSISVNTRARVYYYKSVYANIYNQLYVNGNNCAEKIISNPTVSIGNYVPYTELKSVTTLNSQPDESLLNNKKKIYNSVVSLYNIQKSFTSAYSNFNLASNKITYCKLNNSSSANAKNYSTAMTQFANGIAYDSYEILDNLITLLYL